MKPGAAETLERGQTLGGYLDRLGRQVADRHVTDLPWLTPLGRVLDRSAELAQQAGDRFERHDDGRVAPLVFPTSRQASVGSEWSALKTVQQKPVPAESEPAHQVVAPERQRRLPAEVRASLRRIAGEGADVMTVHDGPASDVIARRHDADAVTIGQTVHVRSGRFNPDTVEGFSLLAHEATHVSESLHAPVHREHAHGRATEEREALRREAQARAEFARGSATVPSYPATTPPSPHRRPQTVAAAGENNVHAMAASSERSMPTDVPTPVDLERLRRDLIGDVMRQLRSEFERGA